MHEHSAAVFAAFPVLHALTMALVLSATLFGMRHLVADWHRSSDHLTMATHVAMGAVMTYTMLAPALPDVVGAAALVAVAVVFCHRARARWRADSRRARLAPLTPGMTMTVVMAVMVMGAARGSPLVRAALLGCVVGCAVLYARPALSRRGDGPRLGQASTPLALTTGMAAMLVVP